jgi:hypothetical protein
MEDQRLNRLEHILGCDGNCHHGRAAGCDGSNAEFFAGTVRCLVLHQGACGSLQGFSTRSRELRSRSNPRCLVKVGARPRCGGSYAAGIIGAPSAGLLPSAPFAISGPFKFKDDAQVCRRGRQGYLARLRRGCWGPRRLRRVQARHQPRHQARHQPRHQARPQGQRRHRRRRRPIGMPATRMPTPPRTAPRERHRSAEIPTRRPIR